MRLPHGARARGRRARHGVPPRRLAVPRGRSLAGVGRPKDIRHDHRRGPARASTRSSTWPSCRTIRSAQLNPDITFEINHLGSVRLATLAREAGVERFIYMSSCSVYGAAGDTDSTETSDVQPLTAYAKCKVLVERDVRPLANDDFSPTFLRNATAFGASPRMRFDLVVNDLAGHAWTEKVIRMDSDGRPWRPFVHILDISQAIDLVLRAPRDVVHDEIFNVGSNVQNYQVREVAEIIADTFPGCRPSSATAPATTATTGRTSTRSASACPVRDALRRRPRRAAAARGLPRRRHDDRAVRVPRPHPDQADPAPARDGPDRRPLLLDRPARCRYREPAGRCRQAVEPAREATARRAGRLVPDRHHPDRRRARVLRPDLGRGLVRGAGRRRRGTSRPTCRPTAIAARSAGCTGRSPLRRVEAAALHPRRRLRRRGRPAPGLADVRPVAGPRHRCRVARRWSSCRRAAPTATRPWRTTRR